MLANSKTILKNQNNLKKIPFTVCHWNCGSGLTKKLDDIQLVIKELKPSLLFITEADRKPIHDEKLIQIQNYQLHDAESLKKHGKSRIIAYTRLGENFKRRIDLESPDSEVIIFDRPNKANVDRIIGVYRPFTGPDGDKTSGGTWDRFANLLQVVNNALEGCSRATILGDFNVDLLKNDIGPDRYINALNTLCDENSLEQMLHNATRIQTINKEDGWQVQESLLDHIYSSDYKSISKCGTMHLSQSDHMAIYVQYSNSDQKSTTKKVTYKRDHRCYDPQQMAILCAAEDWSDVFREPNLQICYDILESKLHTIINSVAPMRKIIVCEKHTVSNHSLRSLEKRRQTLYSKMRKSKTEKSIEDYKKIKKKIKCKVKSITKMEVKKMLKSRSVKNVWQGVNTLCGRNVNKTENYKLLHPKNNKETSDNKECADIFAEVFTTKVSNLADQVRNKDTMTSHISPKCQNTTVNVQFNIEQITYAISQSKNSSCAGPDNISLNYIKDAAPELAPIFKFIFDKAAVLARTPAQWKTAKITPLHKKGEKDNPNNYRPISQLCAIGKLYEKCLLQVMHNNFGESLPSSFQHGFRKNHSTVTAALSIQNTIAKALDSKKKVIVVSTDMSAAFDLLDKDVLLPRMLKMGIPMNLVEIYNDFLSGRKGYVQCGQSKSEEFEIPVGCVQGSPSGPYLFTLLIDGIEEYMPTVKLVAYADDIYLIFQGDTWDDVANEASEKTAIAIEWLKKSGMVINAGKTEAAYFALRELSNPPKLNIDGVQIELKKVLNVLGVLFDYRLKWDVHAEKVLKDARRSTQALRHIHQHLSRSECLFVAHGLFYSKLYYSSCVWLTDMLPRTLMTRITSASNSCLRAVFGYSYKEHSTETLHNEAGVLTPFQRSFQDKAVMFWKIVNSCEPEDLLLDLLTQGRHNDRNSTFYLNPENSRKIGKFSFANRLNNIIEMLGDNWLDLNLEMVKKTLKIVIKNNIPAKCDHII